MFIQLALTLLDVVPVEVHIASVVFWRLMYNVGLGLILHYQVTDRTFRHFRCIYCVYFFLAT